MADPKTGSAIARGLFFASEARTVVRNYEAVSAEAFPANVPTYLLVRMFLCGPVIHQQDPRGKEGGTHEEPRDACASRDWACARNEG